MVRKRPWAERSSPRRAESAAPSRPRPRVRTRASQASVSPCRSPSAIDAERSSAPRASSSRSTSSGSTDSTTLASSSRNADEGARVERQAGVREHATHRRGLVRERELHRRELVAHGEAALLPARRLADALVSSNGPSMPLRSETPEERRVSSSCHSISTAEGPPRRRDPRTAVLERDARETEEATRARTQATGLPLGGRKPALTPGCRAVAAVQRRAPDAGSVAAGGRMSAWRWRSSVAASSAARPRRCSPRRAPGDAVRARPHRSRRARGATRVSSSIRSTRC